MADEQAVSDEQVEATKQHEERKAWAQRQHVSGSVANPLVESRTLRDPLIPQPEPDANPLVPLRFRPERGRNPENNIEENPMGESRTGGGDAEATHIPEPGVEAPQPGPQFIPSDPDTAPDFEGAPEPQAEAKPIPQMTRAELDETAAEVGVDDPQAEPTKAKVQQKIAKADEPKPTMSRAELDEVAERWGIDTSEMKTKAEVSKAIKKAQR
jgi:hypothetical protein